MSGTLTTPEEWKFDQIWTIWDFLDKRDSIILEPKYQRKPVWPKSKQQLLIDSILLDWEIGRIILNAIEKVEDGRSVKKYEVIDGQQRLRAIYNFMDPKQLPGEEDPTITVPKDAKPYIINNKPYDLRGKKRTELDQNIVNKIMAFPISVKVYFQKSDQEVARIFVRVQEGLKLNTAEILNAELGRIRDAIVKLSENKLIHSTKIPEYRFNFRGITANVVWHEYMDFTKGIFRSANRSNMKKMYQSNSVSCTVDARRALNQTRKTFSYLWKQLRKRTDLIDSNPDFITLCLVVSYLRQIDYLIEKISSREFIDFVGEFLIHVGLAKKAFKNKESLTDSQQEYLRYYDNKINESGNRVEERFNFMRKEFLEKFPSLSLRHRPRLFDDPQRRILAKNADYKCENCGEETKLDEGEVHHVDLWSNGGPTSIENGQWLCKKCHDDMPEH